MKIAIHNRPGYFSDRWIEYCKQNSIPFKIVNCYDNDIISQVADCSALMWHHSNYEYRDALIAKQILYSVQQKGLKVFPNFKTNWHFDDKVGQKYLLEAIDCPFVPSYAFFSKKDALKWIKETSFPKVFKLRGGSGSSNVKLVKNEKQAKKLVNKAFGRGFSQFDRINYLKFRYQNFKTGKENFTAVIKGLVRLFIGTKYSNDFIKEKGYIYFQDFIPNNTFDIRVIVIGKKAFALTRGVRKGDFRASGSGEINYDPSLIDLNVIKISFEVNRKLDTQCIAFDYVLFNNEPLIVEISYGFAVEPYDPCPGYWDEQLKWHEGSFNPQKWMIEGLINSEAEKNKLII